MKQNGSRLKSVTMADIANSLGVSVVTVSNALAGKKGVSADLRAAVQLKARELGYIEGGLAVNTKSIKTKSYDVGIISMQRYLGKSDFHWNLYRDIIERFKQYDSYAILDTVSEEDENDLHMPRIIEEHLVDGLIILGEPKLKFLTEITKWQIPVVFLDFSIRDFDFTSVVGDDYYDMYRLASFVISRGHSNIFYVAKNPKDAEPDRYHGYCRAASESEIIPSRPQSLDDALNNFELESPTAFICENRQLAVSLIKSLNDASITVPDTVSVACFSDDKATDGYDITCVRRDAAHMAKVAVEAIRCKLAGEGKIAGRTAIGGKLIAGNTIRSNII